MRKLYLLIPTGLDDYDTYQGFVVSAKDRKEALSICMPDLKATKQDVFSLACIGTSNSKKSKIVLASFNAG